MPSTTTLNGQFSLQPLPGAQFGQLVCAIGQEDDRSRIATLEDSPDWLTTALYDAQGLLLISGLHEISDQPELMVRLSRLFGPEVENYHQTLTLTTMVHEQVPEVLVLANFPPSNRQPPARPEPPLTSEGKLPVQFPHRRGWHTDQSFRRPPPDVSLFYAVQPVPSGQGQTLYANGIAAYAALSAEMKQRVDGLFGIHALIGTGRSEQAVRAGETPMDLLPHQRSQRHPVVRVHPVTGQRALYLCESGQMDWIDGPFEGLSPGPDGEGAQLLYELMSHYTRPEFTYVHEWNRGDLVIYDNRCTIHSATWFDSDCHQRLMWRTTVMGNPGPDYAGERKSWLPENDVKPMAGLKDYSL